MENNSTEEIIKAMHGSRRPVPRADLFTKIEQKIYGETLTVLPVFQLRLAAAAAILLLIFNVVAVQSVLTQTAGNEEPETERLISNYNLYDYE